MKLALVGFHPDVLPLIEALPAAGLQLTVVCDVAAGREGIEQAAPEAQWDESWESLLLGSLADAAIVALAEEADGAERDRRDEQLRKLAGAGLHLLVALPCCQAIVAYELDMIRRDTGAVLRPYNPVADHPAARQLVQLARHGDDPASPVGAAEQLVLERTADDRQPSQVLRQFLRDAHLVDAALGGLHQVSAIAGGPQPMANLSVNISARQGVARWSIGPVVQQAGLQLTLIGSRGRAQLTLPSQGAAVLAVDGQPQEAPPATSPADVALRDFARQCQSPEKDAGWSAACRACEAAESVPRSLQRGRTLEMHNEAPTEEDTFKGVMAAGSCGLLLLTLLVLLVGGVIESVRFPALRSEMMARRADEQKATSRPEPPPPGRPMWIRLWPVYPFALFLVLQLLKLAFPPEKEEQKRRQADKEKRRQGEEETRSGAP